MKIAEGFLRLKKRKAVDPGRPSSRESDGEACYDDRAEYDGEASTDEEYGTDVEYEEDEDYATEYWEDTGYATEYWEDEDYATEYREDTDYATEYREDADYATEYREDTDYATEYREDMGCAADCDGNADYATGYRENEAIKTCNKKESRKQKKARKRKKKTPGFGGEAEEEKPGLHEETEPTGKTGSHGAPAGKTESHGAPAGVPEETELPVIKVDKVTMKFKVATGSTSGLKDYVIQKIKKQITTRDLLALNGVSFEVYKGEVVGVIGTNGSGKSTLLKIISGALKPTGGQVIVDQSKIQLLTLGTGFDMELTAKENVYLNGAIIGYSREFIAKHYEEIVAFAELEGFMDTKVKNFSSGMVSRLGFAIATAGDAAEILILDEVLSVGDEFFRKKSLKRMKEMIHGGSTVIMVSHGMGTIRENCTKVVWIEKGVLQMAGDAKTVCRAYQRMERIVTVDS